MTTASWGAFSHISATYRGKLNVIRGWASPVYATVNSEDVTYVVGSFECLLIDCRQLGEGLPPSLSPDHKHCRHL